MIKSMMIMAAAAAQEDQANPLIPNIWEIVVTSVGFLVLLFIVVKFVVPAMEKSYVERRDAIEGGLERAQAAQAKAAQLKNNYEQLLQDARTEASQIREQARTDAAKLLRRLARMLQLKHRVFLNKLLTKSRQSVSKL